MNRHRLSLSLLVICLCCGIMWPLTVDGAPEVSPTTQATVGERVPSEDALIKDLHSLGLVNGKLNIFRCACPVRDIAKHMSTTQPSKDELSEAESRMQRLHDLGVRTVISFQDPAIKFEEGKPRDVAVAVALERTACSAVGIRYLSRPIANAGENSLQTMSDKQVMDLIDPIAAEIFDLAKTGGVAFHCSAGHDRTGIVTAYIRLKYQHWPVEQAIDEMRRYGHNWPKFSADGGVTSWHEQHLRAIDLLLKQQEQKPSHP